MQSAKRDITNKKPFIEHIHELQKRLLWSVLFIGLGGIVGYVYYDQILTLVQQPLGQTLYYTSPTGGFSFMFKICLTVGFIVALPVVLYQLFGFLGPLIERHQRRTIVKYTVWSSLLAIAGVGFAYVVSLPAALHFLSTFGSGNVQSLITADEYFNFALAYLTGFALLFQIPLVVLFINKINRLRPAKMMGAQRYVILFSFIAAAILTPTPDPMNQLLMAAPAIVMYQISIILVLITNRKPAKNSTEQQETMVTNEIFAELATEVAPFVVPPTPTIMQSSVQQPIRRPVTRTFIDIIPPRTPARVLHLEPSKQEA